MLSVVGAGLLGMGALTPQCPSLHLQQPKGATGREWCVRWRVRKMVPFTNGTLCDKGRALIVSVQEVREGPSEKVTVIHV